MLSELRQWLRATGLSLAGDGMLVRLRRTSIALLCAVAAVGLGLIAFISQLGFPGGFSGPLPDSRTEAGTVHSAIALTQRPRVAPAQPLRPSRSTRSSARTGGTSRAEADAGVGGSRRLVSSPDPEPSPAAPQPSPAPVSQPPTEPAPAASPVASTPAPPPSSTTPAAESPQKSGIGGSSGQGSSGKSKSKAGGPVAAKVTGDAGGKPTTSSTKKPKAQGASKDAIASPPPPAEPAAKAAPDTAGYAAAKEASDAGESDKPHH